MTCATYAGNAGKVCCAVCRDCRVFFEAADTTKQGDVPAPTLPAFPPPTTEED